MKGLSFSEKEMPRSTQGQEDAVRGSKCQDCGNQAKKECSHSRCRTCCKNKGFECQTHVRSTWIPVEIRRRQREEHPSPTANPHHFQRHNQKQNPYIYSGLEELKFPAATSSTAIFRCVRVRSADEAVNEIAYQTSVNIGGHVFSGLLYDQGPDQSFYARGDSSTNPLLDQHHDLNLINNGATMAPLSASAPHEPFLPPPYPFPLGSFRPGMPHFSHPKP